MTGLQSVCLLCCVSMENVSGGLAVVTKTTVSINLQASFNLRIVMFSANLSNTSHLCFSCEAKCLYLWKTSCWWVYSHIMDCFGCFIQTFSPTVCEEKNGTSCEECLKNVTVSPQRKHFVSAEVILFLCVCMLYGKRSVLSGGTSGSGPSSTYTPVRLVWGVTDLIPTLLLHFLLSVFVCVFNSVSCICPECLGIQCLSK